jgi:hypothetical protein
MDSIFVQIASYKDPQLLPTLNNIIENAENPSNLHIVIAWQHGSGETLEDFIENDFNILGFEDPSQDIDDYKHISNVIFAEKLNSKLTILDIDYNSTKGACWARNKIQQFYKNEKYTLQLDSHHRFIKHWDKESINILESIRTLECRKPLLTAYIPSFDPDNDPESRIQAPWKMDFDRFIPEGAVFFRPSTIDNWKELDKPMKSRFYSAHFCFTDGKFVTEVQHDPNYFFHGEEISIAVRAFTHGYDLFHPHKVIAWHEYTRKNRQKIWDDHTTPEKKKGIIELDWVERNNLSHKRNRILFGMDGEDPKQIDFGKYGFGTERTLREYEEYAGICFKYRGVQQDTIDRKDPPNNYPYTTEDAWRESFCRSNDVRIIFHRDELGELKDDYDFFYVGSHDENYEEIYREDLTEQKIKTYLQNEWFDFRLIFLANKIPVTFTVWPHSKSDGWLNRMVKNID